MPTLYIRRASDDPEREANAMRSLLDNLGEGEGVLVYPEGTRFEPKKLARAKQVIAERQPEVAPLADRLQHILPPRLGGPLALLDEAASTGDGHRLLRPRRLRRLPVRQRHLGRRAGRIDDPGAGSGATPTAEIPDGERARTEWLYARWQELDDWVGEHRAT